MFKSSWVPFEEDWNPFSEDTSINLMKRVLQSRARNGDFSECYIKIEAANRFKNTSNCPHGFEILCPEKIKSCILGDGDLCDIDNVYQQCSSEFNCCSEKCTKSDPHLCRPSVKQKQKRPLSDRSLPFPKRNEIFYDRREDNY